MKPAKIRYIHFFKIFIYFGNGQKYLKIQYFYLNYFTLCALLHEVVIIERINKIFKIEVKILQ